MITIKEKPESSNELKELLHPYVREWFFKKFKDFSMPQLYAVMEVHSRNNVLVSAPTGSGKTMCSFLAILNELIDSADKGILESKVYCIYISPLKSLNNDISKNLLEPLNEIEEIAGKKFGIRIAVRTGDTTQVERAKMLLNPPHILISTPESLALMLNSIKFSNHIKNIDWTVIDEIHSLSENKRGVHLSLSLERLQHLSPGMCRVGLSATISPLNEVAKYLAGNERNCKIVDARFNKSMDIKVISPVDDLVNTNYDGISSEMYKLIDKLIHEHKTTVVFTNTRSGTERVVNHLKTKFPKNYTEITEDDPLGYKSLIGAHHGSLSKQHRLAMEEALRAGKLKAIVSSTSLELGLDIGYVDLVICLGSPKSIARLLQRAGRSGHALHATTKARVIAMDRDDLIECAVMAKNAIERKIDSIHIPTNCLDVLAQQIDGMALDNVWDLNEMYKLIKQSYCYQNLTRSDFDEVISYLAGEFVSLEERWIFAKIWKNDGKIGKRGKLGRVIYMTNIGTIPDETFVIVKVGDHVVGNLDEGFLERLKPGDIFVLGGETYEFRFARGMVAQVKSAEGKRPTIPSWFSEMLPLNFDLASEIQRFRFLMDDKFKNKKNKKDILEFVKEYLYLDETTSEAVYNYFYEQYKYLEIPHYKKILVEHYIDEHNKYYLFFHTLFGRRVNDVLSRAVAFAIGKLNQRDIEVGINDNGFYISCPKRVNAASILKIIKSSQLESILKAAIDRSEILRRRFRHCAARALMILRNYKGERKKVGRQQVSSMILMKAVKSISEDFCILKEARREVLEDLMDINNAKKIITALERGEIKVFETATRIPSPFAFSLALQGYSDVLKMEERHEFLQRMHQNVMAKIYFKK